MNNGFSSPARGQVEPTTPRVSANTLILGVVIVAILYLGSEVFVPIALAILLSFVLAIPVRRLQKWGLGHVFPVALVVTLAFLVILGIGGLLGTQLTQLAGDLPRYQWTIRDKIAALRGDGSAQGTLGRLVDMVQDLSKDVQAAKPKPTAGQAADPARATPADPIPVQVVNGDSGAMQTISTFVTPLLHPLATMGLVAIFVVFILLQRGDLRNRFIRLAGSQDLQRTTAAMNDAARRLSRYFLVQVLLNSVFGVVIGVGLWLIGVPSPILWGIIAAVSRFIPYVGAVIAAAGPMLLATAVDPHWSMLFETAALYAVVELTVGQVVEPFLYGHSTGLSPVAVIVSVTFWTWIWGPVGLLLATPLTVCVVVLGRHVEQLAFLDVMFGDRPPLTAAEHFYQRMLAGDPAEALEQAEGFLKDHSLATYYDEIALKGLALAQLDLSRGALDEPHLANVERSMGDLIETLADHDDEVPDTEAKTDAKRAEGDADLDETLVKADALHQELVALSPERLPEEWRGETATLCIAGHNALDRSGAMMLAQLLGKHGFGVTVLNEDVLGRAGAAHLRLEGVRIVCLSFLDSTAPVHVRYAVRRVRRALPGATIVVGSWTSDEEGAAGICAAGRSDHCVTRLSEALGLCLEAAHRAPGVPATSAAIPGREAEESGSVPLAEPTAA